MKRTFAVLAVLSLLTGCVNVTPTPTATPPLATGSPSAHPTGPGSSATPSGAPPTQQGTLDPALATQINSVIASVPAVRELQPTKDVPYDFITREQFQHDLTALNDADVPPDIRHAEERLYKRLGLLPVDANMDALIGQLYGAQVAAYYQPEDGHFYIIRRDQPFGAADKVVVAHEYTHALQDQHFDLKGNTISDPYQGDAQLAQVAVIEGDATLTSQLWATANLSLEEMLQMLLEGFSELDTSSLEGIPLVLRRQLEFPYTEGFTFATALHDQGGYDAVNAAIVTPPASTEQVLHPDKFFTHEAPVDVQLSDASATLGAGWSLAYQQTVGELGIQILATGGEMPPLDVPGLPADWPHADVAAGWGGDRLNMYEGPNGAWRIDWQTVWDTGADAISFRSRVDELSGTFAGTTQIQINDKSVDVTIASN